LFSPIDDYTARDQRGVVVRLTDEGVCYVQRDRTLTVPVEYLYGEGTVLLYESSLREWDLPHRGEPIGSIERQQILGQIGEALDALGVKHRVVA
jgi:hypothetical protein